MQVRRIKNECVKEVINLIHSNLRKDILQTTIYCSEGIEKYLDYLLSSEGEYSGYYYFGCFDGQKLVGFIEWRIVANNSIFLNNIFVNKEYQNQGIGKKLFKTLFEISLSNLSIIRLDVNKDNTAIDWYKKIGFEIKSEKLLYVKDCYELKCKDNSIQMNNLILNYPVVKQSLDEFGFGIVSFDDQEVGIPNKYYYNINNTKIDDNRFNALKKLFGKKNLIHYTTSAINEVGWNYLTSNIRMECSLDDLSKW